MPIAKLDFGHIFGRFSGPFLCYGIANLQTYRVFPGPKLKQLERRKRSPIVYHNFTVDKPMASLTVQLRLDDPFLHEAVRRGWTNATTMAFMLRYRINAALNTLE